MKLRLAIQKSGRLSKDSMALIRNCGINVNNGIGKLKASASNFPLEFLFLRDDDIPGYVADGIANLGIVGENVFAEKQKEVQIIRRLGFSRCRLSLAIPKSETYTDLNYFQDRAIATSYPNLLGDYLKKQGITSEIHEISGSVEIAPGIGLADAVCDLVSSGSTLFTNGLKEVETILESEAVLIGHKKIEGEEKKILNQLVFRINALQQAKNSKYILLNAPKEALPEIQALLPGMKSPTLMPLAKDGWVSLHSVINENDFWAQIEAIKAAGAEGILIIPIEKMVL